MMETPFSTVTEKLRRPLTSNKVYVSYGAVRQLSFKALFWFCDSQKEKEKETKVGLGGN